MNRIVLKLCAATALLGCSAGPEPRDHARARAEMVEAVRRSAPPDLHISPRVLDALEKVPRHQFVPPTLGAFAYVNEPLPIGHGQTISQPLIVAMMTELAALDPGDRVLEVGTGSGYQAAVLATLADTVYSIEIIAPLAHESAARLKALGYANVTVREGDGYLGWPEYAPFDAIVVTAGADHVPRPLIDQLAPGGRLVIPVGPHSESQELILIEKRRDGALVHRNLGPVRFVPLTRREAR